MLRRSGGSWAALLVLSLPSALPGQTVTTRDPTGLEIRRRCEYTMSRKSLPAVGNLLDSAGAAQALFPLFPPDGEPAVISLVYLPGLTRPEVRWAEPASRSDSVLGIIRARASPRSVEEPWAVRLRVTGGDALGIRTEPAVYCPPQPYGMKRVQSFTVTTGPGEPVPSRDLRIVVEVLVRADGRITDVRLVRSSGIRELDNNVVTTYQTASFLPAILDGVPVSGTFRTDGR
jgi:TonB family protein